MTMSYLLMASPSELLRSRCPLPTTTQRRHLRLPWEEGAQTQAPPLLPELSCPGSAPALAQDPAQAPSAPGPQGVLLTLQPWSSIRDRKLSTAWKREVEGREDA